jgi:hypothetical protein
VSTNTVADIVDFLRGECELANRDGVPETATRFREAADKLEQLEAIVDDKQIDCERLRAFLEEFYPSTNGPGWVSRAGERSCLMDFIQQIEAAEAEEGK